MQGAQLWPPTAETRECCEHVQIGANEPSADLGAREIAALVRAVLLWSRLPRNRGEFAHMRSKGLAKVLNVARKLAPPVPHNSEGFAQQLALVGDTGQSQR